MMRELNRLGAVGIDGNSIPRQALQEPTFKN